MDEYRDISKLLFASQSFVAMRGYQPHESKTKNPHEMTKPSRIKVYSNILPILGKLKKHKRRNANIRRGKLCPLQKSAQSNPSVARTCGKLDGLGKKIFWD